MTSILVVLYVCSYVINWRFVFRGMMHEFHPIEGVDIFMGGLMAFIVAFILALAGPLPSLCHYLYRRYCGGNPEAIARFLGGEHLADKRERKVERLRQQNREQAQKIRDLERACGISSGPGPH